MSEKIVFYSLGAKFLEREQDVPAEAKQVMYYSLAIGHHLGVIDCLKPLMECPTPGYKAWVEALPAGEARQKLAGALKWGEITIDATHQRMLSAALEAFEAEPGSEQARWSATLLDALRAIAAEPALYLMVRAR